MIEVASDCGWVKPVRACVALLQALTQGCFWDDSPLLQLPHVQADDPLFRKLSQFLTGETGFRALLPWKQGEARDAAAVSTAVCAAITAADRQQQQQQQQQHSKDILRALHALPRMHVTARCGPNPSP
jgi:hypothetical protein